MHRTVGLPLLLIVLTCLLPTSLAQPDPEAVVAVVCGVDPTVRDALPLCPNVDPAAPQIPDEEHEHQAAPAGANTPQDAGALAADAADTVGEVVADPQNAPGPIAGFVANVVAFVKDMLGIPAAGVQLTARGLEMFALGTADIIATAASATATGAAATGDLVADITTATGSAIADATVAAWDAASAAVDAVRAMFAAPADVAPIVDAPTRAPQDALRDTGALLQAVKDAAPI